MARLDSLIVAVYFVAILTAGYLVGRRHARRSADEFITGGRTQQWWQTALALLGMAVDPGYMSIAALGFLYGLYVTQWTAVHVWFTTWFAAMFFLPIYWRSRIVTTPEFLEKRFNVQCRVVFSLLMVVLLVATLGLGLNLGGLLLHNLVGWNLWVSVAFIAVVAGFYVILGGMRTVLALDVYQAIFLFLTLLAVGTVTIRHIGGLPALASMQASGLAGGRIPSIVPPLDWDITNQKAFFPAQAIILWATIAGLSWLACNFGMAQRILAAKTERDAQKSLLFLGILAAIVPTCSFLVGAAMRHADPGVRPDEAFLRVMLDWFPVGVRGLLTAGMMAALLSTADGLLTGTGSLLLQDVYLRLLRRPTARDPAVCPSCGYDLTGNASGACPGCGTATDAAAAPRASDRELKRITRLIEVAALLIGVALVAVFMREQSAMARLQAIYADVLGVIVAIYVVGMFSRRAAPRAAFIGMIFGIALASGLELLPRINPSYGLNFAYIGFFSFLGTIAVTMLASYLEPPLPRERLTNLTVHTLEDVKGPWVGLKAWPGLWKWALLMAGGWFAASAAWEWYVRSHG